MRWLFSKRHFVQLTFHAAILMSAFAAVSETSGQSRIFVVPAGFSSQDGNDAIPPPFSGRYQQVYSASEFTAIAPAGGWIRSVGFRIDAPEGFSRGSVITNLQISLSTTPRGPDSLSPVFSENIGGDNLIALTPRTANLLFAYSDNSPQIFNTVIFGFDNPFLYNPAFGNLLLDIRTDGFTGVPVPDVPPLDAVFDGRDSVSRVFGGIGAASGTVSTIGLVTRFGVVPIPEPASWLLLTVGTAGVFFLRRRKR